MSTLQASDAILAYSGKTRGEVYFPGKAVRIVNGNVVNGNVVNGNVVNGNAAKARQENL